MTLRSTPRLHPVHQLVDRGPGSVSRREESAFDWIGVVALLALGVIGVFFIYSAQSSAGGLLWLKQVFWLGLGALAYLLISLTDYRFFFRHAHWAYLASLALLVLLWTPLGQERYGSLRWLDLGLLSIQPSESAKLGVLIMVSAVLSRDELGSVRDSFAVLLKVFIIAGIPFGLIFIQPDLGSALVFPPMVFALLYASKLSERFFLAVFLLFLALVGVVGWDIARYHEYLRVRQLPAQEIRGEYERVSALGFLRDYQRERILTFLSPESLDPRGIGVSWNLRQSLQAVGTGGWTGKGWTQGTQARLGYLPRSVAHNDFIFSVLAEEKGFLGGLAVIGLYGVLLGNGVRIAGLARDRFGLLLALGASVVFLVHVFVNIGMTIGLMPITGLPLPLISYGGSFLLSCCILQGLVQSVYRHRRDFS